MQDFTLEFDRFISRYTQWHQQNDAPMVIQHDPDWPSPCEQKQAEPGEWVDWQPKLRQQAADFSQLESALEMQLHPDIKTLFSRYYSDNLNAHTDRGNLQILLPWNEDDFTRLLQNLVGHVLMKRRLEQPVTLFFAVTDEEDFILSVDNESGEVMLEQVGLQPKEKLAPDLASFFAALTPGDAS